MAAGLSPDECAAMRALLDREAIRNCIELYFHSLDCRDFSLLDQVFAPAVDVAEDNVVSLEILREQLAGVSRFRASHHGARNIHITLSGRRAHANTFAMDTLLIYPPAEPAIAAGWPSHDPGPGPILRNHGLRYIDELEKQDQGWRIVKRRGPVCLWRYHVANVQVHPQLDEMRSAVWPQGDKWAGLGRDGDATII